MPNKKSGKDESVKLVDTSEDIRILIDKTNATIHTEIASAFEQFEEALEKYVSVITEGFDDLQKQVIEISKQQEDMEEKYREMRK